MTTDEKQEMLASLEQGRAALLIALEGVSSEMSVQLPGPGKWSILQCVEHLALAEDYLFGQISDAVPSETPLFYPQREAAIRLRGPDRSTRIESPEQAIPCGRFTRLPDALQHFLASRERSIYFVANCLDDLRSRLTSHPLLGKVNCYETLLLIAAHPLRHIQQIQEIKAGLC